MELRTTNALSKLGKGEDNSTHLYEDKGHPKWEINKSPPGEQLLLKLLNNLSTAISNTGLLKKLSGKCSFSTQRKSSHILPTVVKGDNCCQYITDKTRLGTIDSKREQYFPWFLAYL